MSVFVKFWGTRGSIPTPGSNTSRYGGNTSCYELRTDDALIILDAGTGLRELGQDLLRRGPGPVRGHMFFSHAHWDHIQGFPFFTPVYVPQNVFTVYGQSVGGKSIHSLLSGQMSSDYFPVEFQSLGSTLVAGTLAPGLVVDGVRVESFTQWHPGGSTGYTFHAEGLKVVYSTDNEIDLALGNKEAVDADPQAARSVPEAMVKFVQGADLLIADGQYRDDEYAQKRGWGHPRVTTLVDVAIAANVKRLAITHHDPMHSDRDVDAMIEACRDRVARRGSPLEVFGARESMELKLK